MPSPSNGVGDSVVDASVWVSRLLSRDSHHPESVRWFAGQDEAGTLLVGPSLVLAEVTGAIARRTGDVERARRSVALLTRLPTLRLAPVDESLAREAAELAARLRLRGADAGYVAVARKLDLPLVTWDAEQRERGGAAIVVRTPA
jgi:predicted nucleic acid-binding protein